jgi:hypothetical protein
MDTISISTQPGGLRMRSNLSTRVPAEVTTLCSSDRWINIFEIKVEVENYVY